jgi:aminopeptidase
VSDNGLGGLAALAVGVGANVQPGQILTVSADLDNAELAREIAAQAYRRGAQFVDIEYFDPFLKRARIESADEATLDYVPPWYGARAHELARLHGARVAIVAPPRVEALDGLDPARLSRDQLPSLAEWIEVLTGNAVSWTVVPGPTRGWARRCYPEADPDAAYARLREEIAHVCRLDEPDPAGAWQERVAALDAVGERLTATALDSLHFEGPGTDLTIGLLPTSRWSGALGTTSEGSPHLANIPTEEVYTTPDPARADGHVRATKPLVLGDGGMVTDLRVRFEDGRAVEIEASAGVELLHARVARDEGGTRLGEVALVDRESRIGRLGTLFYSTLLDENAVSHIALGAGGEECLGEEDRPRMNRSAIHIDFMIGGDDVDVTGVTADGRRIAVLRGGAWQI